MRISQKFWCVLVVGVVFFGLTEVQCQEVIAAQPSESELVDGYRRAHDRRDSEGMLRLFCWDNVTPEVRHVTEEHVKTSFDDKILTVKITAEHPKQRVNQFLRNGIPYGFNLAVVKELVVESAVSNGGPEISDYPIGIKDGHYAIALMVPITSASATAERSLEKHATSDKVKVPSAATGRVIVPARTSLTVRLDQVVGLKLVESGGGFAATISRPVEANGVTVIPVGATAVGLVTKQEQYSPEMTLKSINVSGKSWPVRTSSIVFNQQISYPAGTELSFDLQFSLDVPPR